MSDFERLTKNSPNTGAYIALEFGSLVAVSGCCDFYMKVSELGQPGCCCSCGKIGWVGSTSRYVRIDSELLGQMRFREVIRNIIRMWWGEPETTSVEWSID